MNILFLILKIIGILLLIVLLLVLLVLFHPVYYKIKARVDEEVDIKGHVWWLFHIVRLEFEIEDSKQEVWLRIFGFRKELQSQAEEEEASEERENPQDAKSNPAELQVGKFDDAKSAGQQTGKSSDENSVQQHSGMDNDEAFPGKLHEKNDETESAEQRDSENSEKLGVGNAGSENGKDKTRDEDKPGKLSGLKTKYQNFTTFIKFLKKEISDERNRMAVSHIWQEFLYLLKNIKPKYMKGNISFSTGDPATTGEVTGVLSMLPILYQYDTQVCPDFTSDEMYVKGNLAIKGHMALFHVIAILIRVIKDKNIKRLLHKYKH